MSPLNFLRVSHFPMAWKNIARPDEGRSSDRRGHAYPHRDASPDCGIGRRFCHGLFEGCVTF